MKMTKKSTSGGVGFARKEAYEYEGTEYEADLKNGDKVKIKNEGEIEEGQFGEQYNFIIETRNGDKKISLNQSTVNVLIDSFGEESKDWVGKEVRVILKKTVIAGKKVIVAYLVTEGWELDEYGELVKELSQESKDTLSAHRKVAMEAQNSPGYAEEAGIDVDSIPF